MKNLFIVSLAQERNGRPAERSVSELEKLNAELIELEDRVRDSLNDSGVICIPDYSFITRLDAEKKLVVCVTIESEEEKWLKKINEIYKQPGDSVIAVPYYVKIRTLD